VDDEALLAACQRGDEHAWRRLVDRYERLVFSIPLNLGLSHDDAADVTQTTFATLLRSVGSIDSPHRLGAWLSTVAKRASIRVIEGRVRERVNDEEPAPLVDDDRAHQLAADIEWLHQGLLVVSSRCRDVLTKLYFSQEAYDVAAAELGMPLGSLGPTRARCLQKLRSALAELYEAER
jgi:RNA polymerase sigma factor (sigma-70 family)